MIFVNDLGAQSVGGAWAESSTNWPGPLFWSINFYHPETNAIYLFGGCTRAYTGYIYWDEVSNRVCRDKTQAIWKFTPSTLKFTVVTATGIPVTLFANGNAVLSPTTGRVFMFLGSISSGLSYVYEIMITDNAMQFVLASQASSPGGTLGPVGEGSVNYFPSARQGSCVWGMDSGEDFILYVFAGTSPSNTHPQNQKSDLWMFNTTSTQWTLLHDDTVSNLENQGEYNVNTWPPSTRFCQGWKFENEDVFYYLNDGVFFSYNITLGQWKFISSGSTNYGTFNVEASNNYPTTQLRYTPTLDSTKKQVFLVAGGYTGQTNQIWRFDMNTEMWTWVYGLSSGTQQSLFEDGPGKITTNPYTPILGARTATLAVTDRYQNIWIYGGSYGTSTALSDLWVISRCELDFDNIYDHPEGLQRPCNANCGSGLHYSLAVDECLGCPAGSWSLAEATACTLCATGKYSTVSNSSTIEDCTTCPAGSYSTSSGYSTCTLCAAGKYSENLGATTSAVCLDCPAGKYNEDEGGSSLSACIDCPKGTWSDVVTSDNSDNCELCDLGFYNDEDGSISADSCKVCPLKRGLSCPKGSSNPYIEKGFWRDEKDPTKIFQCIPSEACKSTGFGMTECTSGYTGDKCAECDEGFYRLNSSCNQCPPEALKWVFASFVLIVAIYILLRLSTPGRIAGAEMRMFIFWIQIISLYSSMSASWPSELLTLFDVISFANANLNIIYSPDCSTDSIGYFTWTYIKLGFTPVVVGLLICLFVIQELHEYFRPNSSMISIFKISLFDVLVFLRFTNPDPNRPAKEKDEFRSSRYIFASLSVVTILYTMEIASLCEPFNCIEQDGKYVIIDDPTQECYTESWYENIPYLLGFCVFYVFFIPAGLIFILIRFRSDLNTTWFQARFSMLTYSYNQQFHWYELITMIKRCVVIAASDCLSYRVSETSKIFVVLGILLAFTVVDCLVNPFRDHGLYSHNLIWSSTAILLLMSTSVYASDSSSSEERNVLTLILIIFIAVAVLFSILRFAVRLRYAAQRRQRFQKSALRNMSWEMQGFFVSFRSYINLLHSGSERSKANHINHWRTVSRTLDTISSQIQEVKDMISESCIKSRIRPETVLSIDPGAFKVFTVDIGKDDGKESSEESVIEFHSRKSNVGEWEEVWSKEFDRPYWHNKHTSASVWIDPSPTNDTNTRVSTKSLNVFHPDISIQPTLLEAIDGISEIDVQHDTENDQENEGSEHFSD